MGMDSNQRWGGVPNSEKHRNFYLYLFVKPNLNSEVYTLIIASIIASLHTVPELVKESGEDGEGLIPVFLSPTHMDQWI